MNVSVLITPGRIRVYYSADRAIQVLRRAERLGFKGWEVAHDEVRKIPVKALPLMEKDKAVRAKEAHEQFCCHAFCGYTDSQHNCPYGYKILDGHRLAG